MTIRKANISCKGKPSNCVCVEWLPDPCVESSIGIFLISPSHLRPFQKCLWVEAKRKSKAQEEKQGVEGIEARKGTSETLWGREAVFHLSCLVWMEACRRLNDIGKHTTACPLFSFSLNICRIALVKLSMSVKLDYLIL